MGLFRKEEEDFNSSAAFESDRGSVIKMVLGVILLIIIFVGIGFVGYNQYQNWIGNETINGTSNVTEGEDRKVSEGNVIINFSDFNLSVKQNPSGIYYYTTQDKVVDEKCYINGKRKSCKSLTNKVCGEEECEKELVTVKECFVNNEKIDCPE